MEIYLPANSTTGYAVPMFRENSTGVAAWMRVKTWENPVVESGTLNLTQIFNATQSGDTLTLE